MATVLEVIFKGKDELTGIIKNSEFEYNKLHMTAAKLNTVLAGAAAVAGVTVLGGAIKSAFENSMELSESIGLMASKMQMSTNEAQKWDYVAKMNGTTGEALAKGLNKIAKAAYDAYGGGKEASEAFKTLNISLKDNEGNLKPVNKLTEEAVFALSEVKNSTERAALAQQLFGKSGIELLPILSEGKEKISELIAESDKYGMILSGSAVKALREAEDNSKKLSIQFNVLKAEMVSGIAPVFVNLTTDILGAVSAIKKFFSIDYDKSIAALEKDIARAKKTWGSKANTAVWESQLSDLRAKKAKALAESNEPVASSPATIEKPEKPSTVPRKDSFSFDKYAAKIGMPSKLNIEFAKDEEKRKEEQLKALAGYQKQYESDQAKMREDNVNLEYEFQEKVISIKKKGYDKEKALLDLKYQRERKMHEGNAAALSIIDASYALDVKELNKSQVADKKEVGAMMVSEMFNTMNAIGQATKGNANLQKGVAYTEAIINTALAASKANTATPWPFANAALMAMAIAQGMAQVSIISSQKFAKGTDYVTSGPQMIMVGDNPGGRERVQVTPMSSPNINGPKGGAMVVNFYDNSGTLSESIRSEIRSGKADKLLYEISRRSAGS